MYVCMYVCMDPECLIWLLKWIQKNKIGKIYTNKDRVFKPPSRLGFCMFKFDLRILLELVKRREKQCT